MFGVCVMNGHSLPLPDVQRIVMEMVERSQDIVIDMKKHKNTWFICIFTIYRIDSRKTRKKPPSEVLINSFVSKCQQICLFM